ncbi:hypothetical protein GCM10010123_02530 [Pilimelia anulata]|uniref:Peptidase S8/S53 domain-containing protein n=1 Tax=Pilimelia anulata TaxID=53371 RepID=A0A8J3AYP3_9ACTN|nr:S8 family serine peptidase [Pilimelia anulata]GGJ76048.1 hypothetical protein GCM10010123_02530 [Pilimelia anulata]
MQPNLNSWYTVRPAAGTDPAVLLRELGSLPGVEAAYQPGAVGPADGAGAVPPIRRVSATPDLEPGQGFRRAGGGVDADHARTVPGGTGRNVAVHVVDGPFRWSHEDLSKLRVPGVLVPNGTPVWPAAGDHGTAIAGILASDANSFGTTGLASDAKLRVTHRASKENGDSIANAVQVAAQSPQAGHVIGVSRWCSPTSPAATTARSASRSSGTRRPNDAIKAATARGVHVVVGGSSVSDQCTRATRKRREFSSHGARVNLQGWSECIVTPDSEGTIGNTPDTK